MKIRITAAAAAAIALACSAAAQASTITFNAEPGNFETPIDAEGFTFDFSAAGWCLCDAVGGFSFSSNGTNRLLASGSGGAAAGAAITMTRIGGGSFGISSFDAAVAFLGGTGGIELLGTHGDSSTAVASFGLTDTHATFALGAAFDNLVSLRFSSIPGGGFGEAGISIDNLVIDERATTGVPEPAAWALMILGFGSAGAALRRRRIAASAA